MNFDQLITSLRELDISLKNHVARTANVGLTMRNWLVGAYLVEYEQKGDERAEYGQNLIREVAKALKIKGLNPTNLELCRRLFSEYPEIPQTLSVDSQNPILQTLSAFLNPAKAPGEIPQTLSVELGKSLNISTLSSHERPQALSAESTRPEFAPPISDLLQKLSFSHFVELLRIDDPLQRAFYEIECVKGAWSVRELKRRIGSLLFVHLGLLQTLKIDFWHRQS